MTLTAPPLFDTLSGFNEVIFMKNSMAQFDHALGDPLKTIENKKSVKVVLVKVYLAAQQVAGKHPSHCFNEAWLDIL